MPKWIWFKGIQSDYEEVELKEYGWKFFVHGLRFHPPEEMEEKFMRILQGKKSQHYVNEVNADAICGALGRCLLTGRNIERENKNENK